MAENQLVYTALNISTIPLQPSINCLQWSADGQLIAASKYAIYVLVLDIFLLPPLCWFFMFYLRGKLDARSWDHVWYLISFKSCARWRKTRRFLFGSQLVQECDWVRQSLTTSMVNLFSRYFALMPYLRLYRLNSFLSSCYLCTELGCLALGSLDNCCRTVAVSPSNLTPEAG